MVAVGVATAGVGDVVLGGVAVTTETTLEATSVIATEEAVTVTSVSVTVSETTTSELTVDGLVKGASYFAAAGGTARGAVDSYGACTSQGLSRECLQDLAGTVAAAADPFLPLEALASKLGGSVADLMYNIGGLVNSELTPEEKGDLREDGFCDS